MSRTPDTSVLVAALASWHPRHADAHRAVAGVDAVVAHVLIETFSVLTRLPAPHRVAAVDVAAALQRLPWRPVGLPAAHHLTVLGVSADLGVGGGAVYDALVAATAREHGLDLVTSDVRARRTYDAVGARYVVL